MDTSRSFAGSMVTSLPPIRMRPSVGCSSPASMRNVVVLPQPEGPSSVTSVPGSIVSDRSWIAVKEPKVLRTCSKTTEPVFNPFMRFSP